MTATIPLPASGTMQNMRILHAAMLHELAAERAITLDLAPVEQADLSLLQLIQALRMTAAEAGR
ncbi:STAS domain-containing protein, partial [Sphingomonas elodea]|uniref:STAS domain-containing protein n=1 Tax=Sphingomonas elodea TaxID=179878 RepID=UPI0002630B4C